MAHVFHIVGGTGRRFRWALGAALLMMCLASSVAQAKPAKESTSHISAPKSLKLELGVKGELSLGLVPQEGFAVSAVGPLRIALAPDSNAGLSLRRSGLRRKHAADPASPAPRFLVSILASKEGTYRLSVTADFWLCRASLCRPTQRKTELAVVVSVPAAPAAEGPSPAKDSQ